MGMRGPRNNREHINRHPPIDHSITPRAIQIYRQMRKIDLAEGPGGDEWWDLNRALNAELHLMAFPVYEDPDWESDQGPTIRAPAFSRVGTRIAENSQASQALQVGNLKIEKAANPRPILVRQRAVPN